MAFFPYHTLYQPKTSIPARGNRADIKVLGWYQVWHKKCHIIISILELFLTKKNNNICLPQLSFTYRNFTHTNCLSSLQARTQFHENTLNGFQVIEWIWNDHCQISKGNNSKNVDKSYGFCGVHVVWWCFIFLWSFMKISWTVFTRNYHCQISKGNNSKNV